METLTKIKQFLIDNCCLSQFQVWQSIKGLDFSLVLSHHFDKQTPAPETFVNENICPYEAFTDYYHHYSNHTTIVIRMSKSSVLNNEQELKQIIDLHYLQLMLDREKYIRNKMMESIRDISVLEDLDDLLKKILENALSVIPAADMGVLWMYEPGLDALFPKAWTGGPNQEISKMRMKVGEGIIGKTFKNNESFILTNIEGIISESSNISSDNLFHLYNSVKFDHLKSIISVPIKVEESTLCVLIVYQNGPYPLLTKDDQQLLESFSDQVSIVLRNSKLYQNLKKQNDLLIQRDAIHNTLIKLSLQSKGLQKIANEIRKMINHPLMIVDLTDHQQYSSPTHLKWNFPLDNTILKTQSFFTEAIYSQSLYIHPIIAIDVPIGVMAVEMEEDELFPLNKMIIEQASSVIALEIIRNQTLMDSYYQSTNDLFNDFINCREYNLIRKKAIELGIDDHPYYMATVIQIHPHADFHFLNMQMHKLISQIKKYLGIYVSIVFGYGNNVTLLCHFKHYADQDFVKKKLELFHNNWIKIHGESLKIGIGTCYPSMDNIAKSFSEADKALSFLISRQVNCIVNYQDIGINHLFIHQPIDDLNSFVNEVFHPLQSNKDGTLDLEQTLLAFMENDRQATQTAKHLHIHVNTLYQRIKRIEEKLQISFSNTEDILKIQLACYLRSSIVSLN
ncbi:helix-turn-helix domain-containing protein [Cytobacillus oceanisediminis]|uniref:helix-turn-helix domain-containing protein n=1 Tax=Cytobacillus oceanisediminis TaxID=665099 RepID=UPI0020793884|nr:helix-turn-helix domain-containing protein [Cytobacillus oceanisediminis]USK42232.1 helix-turn-helix domain-containing protein [Cytobacillus oceanisediminis]